MIQIKSIYKAAIEEYNYQQNILNKIIVPATSGYNFIDNSMLGGFNTSDIALICGLSGVGKSTFATNIAYNIAKKNEKVRVLYISFEAPGRKLAAKIIGSITNISLQEMYSGNKPLTEEQVDILKDIPIDIIEVSFKVDTLKRIIDTYCNKNKDSRNIVIIDHSLLLMTDKSENEVLKELSHFLNFSKKIYNIVYIVVSQLNNAMLDPKRLVYPSGHYPNQTDIFGSKYLYHLANIVICLINPAKLNIASYGKDNLPIYTKDKREMIYAHIIKSRDGQELIEPLLNRLNSNKIEELNKETREKFRLKYNI